MVPAETTTIYETVAGSRAYDLATPDSDQDLRGVVVGPRAWYHGFLGGPEQITIHPDHVCYEVRKLVRLAAAANPSVLELLWTDPRHHRVLTPAGRRLLDARDAYLSLKVRDTFGGYALAQLKRIRTHRRWLLEPPTAEPSRAAFGLPERTLIPRDQLRAAAVMIADGRLEEAELTPNFLLILEREKRYRAARKEWEQHRNWLVRRNPQRAALERRYGYDTKHAQHLVRLLRMGLEILRGEGVIVTRPDRAELLAIRRGALSYDELLEASQSLHRQLAEAAASCELPAAPDEAALDALCVGIVEEVLSDR